MNRSQHLALVRQVTAALDVALASPADEPDVEAGLVLLEPIYGELFGPRSTETWVLAEGILLAIFRRATFGTLAPASDVVLRFGRGHDPGEALENVIEPDEVPPLALAWGRILAASLRNDWETYVALFEGYHGGEEAKARELIGETFGRACRAAATVACSCGQPHHDPL